VNARSLVRFVPAYYAVVGAALSTLGAATRSPVATGVGLLLLAAGVLALRGRGEAGTWLRGELDERRSLAVDHALRSAYVVLAWWIGGVALLASGTQPAAATWTLGIPVSLAAAFVDYALVLRRS